VFKWVKSKTSKESNPPKGEFDVSANRSSLPKGFTSEEQARNAILTGSAPENLWTGTLKFEREPRLRALPRAVTAYHISIIECPNFECLPENLWASSVTIQKCPAFRDIPASAAFDQLEVLDHSGNLRIANGASLGSLGLTRFSGNLDVGDLVHFKNLVWPESPLESFPERIRVSGTVDLSGSRFLKHLPTSMTLNTLILRRCQNLQNLPDRLDARLVDLSGCIRLRWQESAFIEVSELNLSDCVQIDSLPWWLTVNDAIDVANTGLTELPQSQSNLRLIWRGVEVNARVAFHPEQITVQEVFAQRNSEVRRVMLERIGWERFLREAKPRLRHNDKDPGGERRLFHVSLPDREDLLVLNMSCPSTGRNYFIRVPPRVNTCHEAAAWIAGFENPDEYEPLVET
jgi:hypothetical protein